MIRSISFLKHFIPLIESGEKTVTRRAKFTGNPGDIYYFKIGRLGKKQGYLEILGVTKIRLRDIRGDQMELEREGMLGSNYDFKIQYFMHLWDQLNRKGCKWKDNPKVYRIEFKYLGEKLNEDF